MAVYYGRHRNTYVLKDAPVASGGEGSVYEIEGNSNLVAKLYHDKKFIPLPNGGDSRRYLHEKILTMLDQPVSPYVGSGANQALTVAWPQDILMDSHGVFVGYTMPRVNSRYHIYAASRERERKQLYPNYTWKTAVVIASNLALAVKIVHSTNAVIGDFNTNNIMLDDRGHVTLIDTDSFNITNQRTGKVYKCTVGVAENLPPELQGKNLAASTSIFTQQTDNFALAIHIFSLLMNNCHPFSCSSMNQLQSSASGNPAARNIVQGNCPYVPNGRGTPAAAAPDIMMLPPELRQLFERAFAYDVHTAIQAATIARRPSAEEWFNALQRLVKTKFAVCGNPSHVYPPHNRMCPWCAVEQKKRSRITINPTPTPTPNPPPPRPQPPQPPPPSPPIRRSSWPYTLVCVLAGCISGPMMSQYLILGVDEMFNLTLSTTFAYVAMAIAGFIVGALLSGVFAERYQKAYNAWPWLLTALLVPVLTALAAAAVVIAIAIFIGVLMLAVTIACICGMCDG